MTLSKGYVTAGATTAVDARQMDGVRVIHNADGTVRTGVSYTISSSGNVVGSQSSMAVVVVTADFVLSRSANDGAIVLSNRGSVVVAIPAAPASNSRYDVVYVKQNDSTQGDADSTSFFGVVSGTAAASPVVPTVPTGALALATVLVPSGVTATNSGGVVITNVFQNTAMLGAPISFPSLTAMRAAAPAVETLGRVTGPTGSVYRFDGTDWRPLNSTIVASLTNTVTPTQASGTAATLVSLGSAVSTDSVVLNPTASGVQVKFAGQYRVSVSFTWDSNSTGDRYVEAVADGASFAQPVADRRSASGTSNVSISGFVVLNAGQLVRLQVWQNSGAARTYSCRLTVELIALS